MWSDIGVLLAIIAAAVLIIGTPILIFAALVKYLLSKKERRL